MADVKFPSEWEIEEVIEYDSYIEKIGYRNDRYTIVYEFEGNYFKTQYDLVPYACGMGNEHGADLSYENFKTKQVSPVDRVKTVYLSIAEMENKND
jgi:hypothetical protein